jgi:hypothetical protein
LNFKTGAGNGAGFFIIFGPPAVATRIGSADISLRRSRGLVAALTPPSWRFAPKGKGSYRMPNLAPRCAALEL